MDLKEADRHIAMRINVMGLSMLKQGDALMKAVPLFLVFASMGTRKNIAPLTKFLDPFPRMPNVWLKGAQN